MKKCYLVTCALGCGIKQLINGQKHDFQTHITQAFLHEQWGTKIQIQWESEYRTFKIQIHSIAGRFSGQNFNWSEMSGFQRVH